MKIGDECHIHAGRYAGRFGRVLRAWQTGYQVRIHNEFVGGGPKVVRCPSNEVSPTSGIELLARLGKKAHLLALACFNPQPQEA